MATKVISVGVFPKNSAMVFRNSTAPVGWTKLSIDDHALRTITSAGASISSASVGFLTRHTTTARAIEMDLTTLDTLDIPLHYHRTPQDQGNGSNSWGSLWNNATDQGDTRFATKTGYEGGGLPHTHGGVSFPVDLNYVDVIVASKDY